MHTFKICQMYLCDGEGLLLHDLVQHRACVVTHLVELVDAANAVVAQHQRSGLQHQLPGLWVLHHVGGETHSAGALSWRVLAAGNQVVDVLQQLGLTGSGVSAEQDVHLCTEVTAAGLAEVLASASKKLQQDALERAETEMKELQSVLLHIAWSSHVLSEKPQGQCEEYTQSN